MVGGKTGRPPGSIEARLNTGSSAGSSAAASNRQRRSSPIRRTELLQFREFELPFVECFNASASSARANEVFCTCFHAAGCRTGFFSKQSAIAACVAVAQRLPAGTRRLLNLKEHVMQHRKKLRLAWGAASLALAFGTPAVFAEQSNPAQPATQGQTSGSSATAASSGQAGVGQVSKQDQEIMRDIAQANLAEIQTAQIALERAQDAQIRQYAQRMIEDHSRLQERLADLARVKDVQLPNQPEREHRDMAERLSKMEGPQFDRAYRRQVGEQAHQNTHQMLRQSVTRADDPQLMAFITQALPLVEQHLNLAQDMSGAGAASGGASAAGAAASGTDTGEAESSAAVSGSSSEREPGKQD
jgi:putative membrane protein